MIYYLSTREHAYTLQWFLQAEGGWGAELADEIVLCAYEDFLQVPHTVGQVYIFSDLERIPAVGLQRLAQCWQQLAQHPTRPRLLNDPARVLKRLPLLQALYAAGVNQFQVYPILAQVLPQPERFPVFVREANDHHGPLSGLLYSQAELAAEVDKLRAFGELGSQPIVTEFLDSVRPDGHYRKYAAFRIGAHVIGSHIQQSQHWMVKRSQTQPNAELIADELAYVQQNPRAEELMAIFQRAHIDYGRIDYTLYQGQIQVFEINTNPTLLYPRFTRPDDRLAIRTHVGARLVESFRALLKPE